MPILEYISYIYEMYLCQMALSILVELPLLLVVKCLQMMLKIIQNVLLNYYLSFVHFGQILCKRENNMHLIYLRLKY